MTDIRQFCQSSILQNKDMSFDFDVSTITDKEILYNSVKFITEEVFSSRPATEPYVDALLMFGTYLHKNLQHETWYNLEMLVEVMAYSLEKINFKLRMNISTRFKIFVNSMLGYFASS